MENGRLPGTPVGGENEMVQKLRDVRQRLFSPQPQDVHIGTPQTPTAAVDQHIQQHDVGAAAAGSEGPVTLAAIAGLLKQEMAPVKESMQSLEKQMGDLSVTTDKRMGTLEEQFNTMDVRVEKLEEIIEKRSADHDGRQIQEQIEMMEKVQALEKEIQQLKQNKTAMQELDVKHCTAVIGGLAAMKNIDEARSWLTDKPWHLHGPQPSQVYSKGDFHGIAFMKFNNQVDRDEAVKMLRQSGGQHEGSTVWAKPDQALQARVLTSFVFGLKHVLTTVWKDFDKTAVWSDPETGRVWLGDANTVIEEIVTASVVEKGLKLEYGEGWKEYLNDKAYTEFKDMMAALEKKLDSAAVPAKGGGKSKSGKAMGGSGR